MPKPPPTPAHSGGQAMAGQANVKRMSKTKTEKSV